jgi:hypothetical protein
VDDDSDPESIDEGAEATDSDLSGSPLLIRTRGGSWSAPSTTTWGLEAELRDILAANPTILPGVADRAAAAVSELGVVGIGYVDVVVVEPDGSITVCEAKLRRNPEIRREVLGQILAYAAGLATMTYADLDASWTLRAHRSLSGSVMPDADAADVEAFERAVGARLAAGRMRLVIAVDELTDELRSTVSFLARHTTNDLDLVALELAFASHGEVEVLVPRVWGTELTTARRTRSADPQRRSKKRSLDTVADVAAAVEAHNPGGGRIVESIVTRLAPRLSYLYFGSPDSSDCVVTATDPVKTHPFLVRVDQPGIRLAFQWLRTLGDDRVEQLLVRLEQSRPLAPAVAGVREAAYMKRPLIPFSALADPQVLDLLIQAVHEALEPDGGAASTASGGRASPSARRA